MEDVFEFLFGASGRISRAKYWRSNLLFTVAGLMAAVILASFALTIWGFVEIGCLRGTAGSNTYGPDPLLRARHAG